MRARHRPANGRPVQAVFREGREQGLHSHRNPGRNRHARAEGRGRFSLQPDEDKPGPEEGSHNHSRDNKRHIISRQSGPARQVVAFRGGNPVQALQCSATKGHTLRAGERGFQAWHSKRLGAQQVRRAGCAGARGCPDSDRAPATWKTLYPR